MLRLDLQHNDLINLRNQASIGAAVTGLIGTVFASLLGPDSAQNAIIGEEFLGLSIMGLFVIIFFSASIYFSATVLIWLDEFTFSFDPPKILEESKKHPSIENLLAAYSRDGAWFFQDNERKISNAQNRLWWAMVLGWAQIIPWVVLIIGAADVGKG